MNNYGSQEAVEKLGTWHAVLQSMTDESEMEKLEIIVAKLLRAECHAILKELTTYEQGKWAKALKARDPAYASEQGWLLSGDVPSLIKPFMGPTFDFTSFAAFWADEVPGFSVIDIDAKKYRTSCRQSLEIGKSWIEHMVAYLHFCPLFYRSGK